MTRYAEPTANWHWREEWQLPTQPVAGPALPWRAIDAVVLHYTAAINLIDGDPGENWAGIPAYLRSIQKDYTVKRGYSIGYNVAIDARGHVWECRGFDIKCAANKGHNDHCFAILLLVDGNDGASYAAVEAARKVVEAVNRKAGRKVATTAHGHLLPGTEARPVTACPGIGIKNQIKAGVFDVRSNESDDEMKIITNAERFFDDAPGVTKFGYIESKGKLRILHPDIWELYGSQPGTPWTNAQLGEVGFEPQA